MRYMIVILIAALLGFGVWYVRYYHAPRFVPVPFPAVTPSPSSTR